MAIKVYGNILSTAVMRVILCLHEKGLDYELVRLDLRGKEHKREPFLSLSPFGQIPGFEDGDLELFDSRGINRYIAHAYADRGTSFIWQDPKKMAIVYVWEEVEAQNYESPATKLAWELGVKHLLGLVLDDAIVEQQVGELAKVLDVYEARLAQSKYLGGDTFSLADLHHLPTMSYLMESKIKAVFDSRPRVSAWYADIMARPSWQKIVDMKNDQIRELKETNFSY